MEKYSLRHIIRQGLNGLFYIFRKELKATIKDSGSPDIFPAGSISLPVDICFHIYKRGCS